MNRTFVLLLVAGLALGGPVSAGLSLHVTADHESKVYLGSTYLGNTPIDLSSVKLGTHTVKVKSLETGETQTFSVVSSRVANTEKSLHATFDSPSGRRSSAVERDDSYGDAGRGSRFRVEPYAPPRREYSSREYGYAPYRTYTECAPAPTYYRPAPTYGTPYQGYYPAPAYSTPYYPSGYSGDPYVRRGSSTDRFRNVVLGAAIANEVFNNGRRSRSGIRRGLVGAGLLNELVGGSSRGGFGGYGGYGNYGGSAFGSLFGF